MKIIGKVNPLTVWIICVIFSVTLRTYELIALTERKTGFMNRDTEPVAYALLFLIGLTIVFFAVYFKISKINVHRIKTRGLFDAVVSLVLAAGISADYLINGFSGVPSLLSLLCSVFQVITIVCFTSDFICILLGKTIGNKFLILPLIFYVMKSASIFIQSFYHTVISDTVFDVGAYSFVMLFFLELVKFLNGFENKKSRQKIALLGAVSSALCIVSALPKFVVSIFVSEYALHDGVSLYILPLATGLFIAVYTFRAIKEKQ